MSFGYVYVLTNDSLPYVKVGQTTRSPEFRAKELSTTGVPTPFKVAYKVYVENCERFEQDVHRQLRQYRVRNNREFFEADLTTVVSAIEKLHTPSTNVDEEEDTCFDPISYIQHLAKERVIDEEEQQLKNDEAIIEARTHINVILDDLTPLNGRYNISGNQMHFFLNEDTNYIKLHWRETIDELPDHALNITIDCGARDNIAISCDKKENGAIYYEYAETSFYQSPNRYELLDESAIEESTPRQIAKDIIHSISWATEEETQQRINPPMSLKDMLQTVWLDVADLLNYSIYLKDEDKFYVQNAPVDFYRSESREEILVNYFDSLEWLKYAESAASNLCEKGMIPRVVSDSWAIISYEENVSHLDGNRLVEGWNSSAKDYFLSIDRVIPDEISDGIEVTIDNSPMGTYATTKCGLKFQIKSRYEYSKYNGKRVLLNNKSKNPVVRLA